MRQYCWRKSQRQPRRIHLKNQSPSPFLHTFWHCVHSLYIHDILIHSLSSSLGLGYDKSNAAVCCMKIQVGSFLACLPELISFGKNKGVGLVHQLWNHQHIGCSTWQLLATSCDIYDQQKLLKSPTEIIFSRKILHSLPVPSSLAAMTLSLASPSGSPPGQNLPWHAVKFAAWQVNARVRKERCIPRQCICIQMHYVYLHIHNYIYNYIPYVYIYIYNVCVPLYWLICLM